MKIGGGITIGGGIIIDTIPLLPIIPGGALFRTQLGAATNTTTTYNIVVPLGVSSIAALAIGAGGGGGGASSTATASAGGGGGGALSYFNSLAVTPGETLTVGIPNQSAGGSTGGSNGSTGGDAYIQRSGTSILLAKGGSGSAGRTASTSSAGAAGGVAASGIGTVKQSGGYGGAGIASTDQGGGGGGAAGYSGTGGTGGTAGGNGNDGSGGGGGGGASYLNNIIGGSGGGTLWYGIGNNGGGGSNSISPVGFVDGDLGSSLGGSTYVDDVASGASTVENMIGMPGGGGAGAPSAGTTSYSGQRGAGGAVRILWGPNNFDWGTPTYTSNNALSVAQSTTSSTTTITIPDVQLGDYLVLVDYANGATLPTQVVPSGWTLFKTNTGGTTRLTVSTKKVLSYTETGTVITGQNGSSLMSKFLLVIRGTAGAELSDWDSTGSAQIESTNAFSYTQTGTSGQTTNPTTIDCYAMGIPVGFLFFGSGTGTNIDPDTDMTFSGATTIAGPSAKTYMKVKCLSQTDTAINMSVSTNDLGATNTSSFWMLHFY
jgi:hypothetical protein